MHLLGLMQAPVHAVVSVVLCPVGGSLHGTCISQVIVEQACVVSHTWSCCKGGAVYLQPAWWESLASAWSTAGDHTRRCMHG
jgi:hypothetical protein